MVDVPVRAVICEEARSVERKNPIEIVAMEFCTPLH